jgi:hypothetical protein
VSKPWAEFPIFCGDAPPQVRRLIRSNKSLGNRPITVGGVVGDVAMLAVPTVIITGLSFLAGVFLDLLLMVCGVPPTIANLTPWAIAMVGAVGFSTLVFRTVVSPSWRVARQHYKYLDGHDFDAPSRMLVGRAQRAIGAVLGSQVNAAGLLDEVANAVLLPQELWDIAQTLRRQAVLRAKYAEAGRGVIMTPELEVVLAPQGEALSRAVEVVTGRIVRLEAYAAQVAEADSAYRAQQVLEANDEYRDLLAESHDSQGVASLSADAEQVRLILKNSLAEAIETGQALALP